MLKTARHGNYIFISILRVVRKGHNVSYITCEIDGVVNVRWIGRYGFGSHVLPVVSSLQ